MPYLDSRLPGQAVSRPVHVTQFLPPNEPLNKPLERQRDERQRVPVVVAAKLRPWAGSVRACNEVLPDVSVPARAADPRRPSTSLALRRARSVAPPRVCPAPPASLVLAGAQRRRERLLPLLRKSPAGPQSSGARGAAREAKTSSGGGRRASAARVRKQPAHGRRPERLGRAARATTGPRRPRARIGRPTGLLSRVTSPAIALAIEKRTGTAADRGTSYRMRSIHGIRKSASSLTRGVTSSRRVENELAGRPGRPGTLTELLAPHGTATESSSRSRGLLA